MIDSIVGVNRLFRARLDEIVRQKDPALKAAVEQLASDEVKQPIDNLNRQGRMHEIEDCGARLITIAEEYAWPTGRNAGNLARQRIAPRAE